MSWWSSKEEIERLADMVARADPDLLLITGDMVDHHPGYVHALADAFEGVNPRLGRYAIIGNHDAYTGRTRVARLMGARGFRMLRNEWVVIEKRGARLVLAGMDDSAAGWTGADKASAKIREVLSGCPMDIPSILLTHRPPSFADTEGLPIKLTLSGHTHGGQLRLPFGGPGFADLTFEHVMGLYSQDQRSLYVSRGIGTVGLPYRLFCLTEIALLTLRNPSTGRCPDE
jgi:predicted MPP superfamily phosphohydrolase